jgi:hypothetical protein
MSPARVTRPPLRSLPACRISGLQKVIVADRFCRDEIAQCGLPYANSLGKRSKPGHHEPDPAAGE